MGESPHHDFVLLHPENNNLLFINNDLNLKIPSLINLLWKTRVDFNKMIVDTPFQK